MSSKLYSRSGVFVWSPRGVQTKGFFVADFAQFFDPNATSIEQKIDFVAKNELYDKSNLSPSVTLNTNYRFNELAWSSMCSDAHPNGIIAGGTEDGTVVFFDADKFINHNQMNVVSARKDHHGHVLTVDVSRDGRWIASGGGSGQVLLWDCANLKTPFSPGSPNFQDQVKLLRWNQKNESVFASISSRRVSCWDLRRNGSPVLEFAEFQIPGCDWSSLCWNPSDASQLVVASQSQHASVIQKWDSRFTSTPVKEYRHHNIGVTSLDWNKGDDRLLISSGCDGQVIIWNHETAEVLGGVGSLQGDWIRSVKWNEDEPSQFAIQYFQHPIQISSLTSLGTPQPGAEVLAARVSDQFVPAWHRAPLIGSSVSLGARLATFWKSYDPMSQKFIHNVEIETIVPEEDIGSEDIAQFLHIKDDKRNLGWYLHEKAYATPTDNSEDADLQRKVWLMLLALQEGAGRSKMLEYLGLVQPQQDETQSGHQQSSAISSYSTHQTTATSATTRSARSSSLTSAAETEVDVSEESIIDRCSSIDWRTLDSSGWDLLLQTIRQDHLAVIKVLMAANQHVAAMMYAAQHETEHLTLILEDYERVSNRSNPLSSLMLALSTSSSAHRTEPAGGRTTLQKDNILSVASTFPDDKWVELLGLIIAHESNNEDIRYSFEVIGDFWLSQGKSLRACIAYAISGQCEKFLKANTSFSQSDRLKQALILHQVTKAKLYSEEFVQLITTFANRLLLQGSGAVAWNLVKFVQVESDEFLELKWTCYNVAGGRDCTGDQPPFNPYNVTYTAPKQTIPQSNWQNPNQRQYPPVLAPQPVMNNASFNPYNPAQSQAPPPPTSYQNGRRDSNLAPMPPSSTFYPTPSWDHKPPPAMPPNMPPPKPSAPVTPGWNDPPPMALKSSQPVQPKQNVMEINWKPMEVAPTSGGMMPHQQNGFPGAMGYHNVMASAMQGMNIQNPQSSATNSTYPSPSSTQQRPPSVASVTAPPPIQLSPEDEKIVEPLNALAQFIIENAKVQARIEKANDLKARIQTELPPRLSANRLSAETKQHLMHMSYFISMRQIREAQAVVAQMARNSGDFVEISSFLPALKSLLSLASH